MELQEEAVSCGVDSHTYWHMTPRDIRAAIKGHNKRIKADLEADIELRNMFAWVQGKYNSFAQHDPKHYPNKPWKLETDEDKTSSEEMTVEQMQNWAKKWASQNGNILI